MNAEAYDQLVLYRQRELAMANTGAELEQLHKRYAAEDRARQEVETKARYGLLAPSADTTSARSATNGELHDLRQRVARLEQMVSRKGPLVQAVGDLAEHLGRRLHALEQRAATALRYVGTFDATRQYVAGDAITDRGSLWCCKSACLGQRPPSDHWQLTVKRGSNGKDAPQTNGPVPR
jgi:hypothetical protein